MNSSDYRKRIYDDYAHAVQGAGPVFDAESAARWGKGYDYHFRGWSPDSKDAAIVDLACGGGRLLNYFKSRGYTNLRGMDISSSQVALARQVVPTVEERNVLEFLENDGGKFHLVVGLDLIEHLRKDEVIRFLDGCFSVLAPGGRLILQTPNADSIWCGVQRYGDFTHEVCFNPKSLSDLLGLAGFTRIEMRESGPIPWGYSAFSSARYLLWRMIRCGMMIWNVAETGHPGSGIYSRVFLASAMKD